MVLRTTPIWPFPSSARNSLFKLVMVYLFSHGKDNNHPLEKLCRVYPANYPILGVSISKKTHLKFPKMSFEFQVLVPKDVPNFPKITSEKSKRDIWRSGTEPDNIFPKGDILNLLLPSGYTSKLASTSTSQTAAGPGCGADKKRYKSHISSSSSTNRPFARPGIESDDDRRRVVQVFVQS